MIARIAHDVCSCGLGWVAGQAFGQDGRAVSRDMKHEATFDTCTAAVEEGWWGSFVVIGEDAGGRVHIYRDPSGEVACYYLRAGRDWLFGTDARTLIEASGRRPAINRTSLGLALRFPDLRSPDTAIEGLCELLPGQSCSIDRDGQMSLSLAWMPRHWRPSPAPPEASVRQAVLQGVRAALHGASNPLVQLSGGLDSAIVAAAGHILGESPQALNLVTPGPEGDERRFARSIAARLGIKLHEVAFHIEDVDLIRTRAGFLPRPTHRLFAQSMDDAVQRHAADHRHDAVLTGGGGDSVFSYLLAGFATADPLARLALRMAITTALDEAAIEQVSCWRILGQAAGHALRASTWLEAPSYLSADVLALSQPDHPWRTASRLWPPGKRAHVDALVTIHNYLDPFRGMAVPVHFPLLHRPVLEACLAIPSRDWVAGGWNRAVARNAFADSLPQAVVRRRSKGTYERFAAQLFELHRPRVRDHLLGGCLAALGLLDGPALETWFASQQPLRSNRILALIEAESWCRHWTAAPRGRREA